VVLMVASWGIIRDALVILVEAAPADVNLTAIAEILSGIDSVKDVHHLHAWTITSGQNVISAHLSIGEQGNSASVLSAAHRHLAEIELFAFATIQVEDHCTNLQETRDMDFLHSQHGEG
jgi:cobalt-zinc-cadmium efflux system protein